MPSIAEYDHLIDVVEFVVAAELVVTCIFAFAISVSRATLAL